MPELPIENWLKFLTTQAGRDKLYRFIQYFSRFLSYHLKKEVKTTDHAQRLEKLSAAVGMGRKLFRMGKPLDFLQTILKTVMVKDEVIKWGTIFKCTGYGGWLILDMLQWLQGAGVLRMNKDTMSTINKQAPRLWLIGIVANLIVNLHKIQLNFYQRKVDLLTAPSVLDKEMKKVTKDAVQDLIDLTIPLSILGWINVSPGTVGLAGSITSLMGAASIYPSSK